MTQHSRSGPPLPPPTPPRPLPGPRFRGPRPNSLRERGTAVPFEAPALFAARVRADERHGLAMLLHNFTGNGSVYVVPWRAVPDTVALSQPDRIVHLTVGEQRAVTPRAVAQALRTVDATGLRGPEAQAAEAARQEADASRTTQVHGLLMLRLLRALGVNVDQLLPTLSATPATTRNREILTAAAEKLQIPAGQLSGLLAEVARALLPVGLASERRNEATVSPLHGPLRKLHQDLAGFERHLSRRGDGAATEVRGYYLRTAGSASETVTLAGHALQDLDGRIARLPLTLAAWPRERRELDRAIERLEWLLDGWEQVMEQYAQAMTDTLSISHERTMAVLSSLAPMIPSDEAVRLSS